MSRGIGWAEELLYEAVCENNYDRVKLLRAKAKCNIRLPDGSTPLTKAVQKGSEEMVKALLADTLNLRENVPVDFDEGDMFDSSDAFPATPADICDVNFQDYRRGRPLLIAVREGRANIVALLLAAGASVNPSPLTYERRPLEEACKRGNVDVVRMLLRAGAKYKNEFFAAAAKLGHREVCEVLVSGIGVEALGEPLIKAVGCRRREIVEFLLNAGADPCSLSDLGASALEVAVRAGDFWTVRRLLPHYPLGKVSTGVLHRALGPPLLVRWDESSQFVKILLLLLDSGLCDVDGLDPLQGTPLMRACAALHPEIVSELLKRGASVTAKCAHGRTALHYAVRAYVVPRTPWVKIPDRNIHRLEERRLGDMKGPSLRALFEDIATTLVNAGADVNDGFEHPLSVAFGDPRDFLFNFEKCLPRAQNAFLWLMRNGASLSRLRGSEQALKILRTASSRPSLVRLVVTAGLDLHRVRLPCEDASPLEEVRCAGGSVCTNCRGRNKRRKYELRRKRKRGETAADSAVFRGEEEEGNCQSKCWLLNRKMNAVPLKELARTAFRDGFPRAWLLKPALEKMTLPRAIKRYLMFEI